MSALGDTLAVMAAVLDERELPWFVFGAQAVAIRGAPRATQDIDVTVDVDRARLPELMQALESRGLRHRYPDIVDELLSLRAHRAPVPAKPLALVEVLGARVVLVHLEVEGDEQTAGEVPAGQSRWVAPAGEGEGEVRSDPDTGGAQCCALTGAV